MYQDTLTYTYYKMWKLSENYHLTKKTPLWILSMSSYFTGKDFFSILTTFKSHVYCKTCGCWVNIRDYSNQLYLNGMLVF